MAGERGESVVSQDEDPTVLHLKRADGTVVPLRFLVHGSELTVVVAAPLPRWTREAEESGQLLVRLPNAIEWRIAKVREVRDGEEIASVRDRFREALGGAFWDRNFRGPVRVLSLTLSAPICATSWEERVREEFDALAPVYARRVADEPFQGYLRARAIELLQRTFPTPARLIEFGPGTGAQTLPMLRAGHRIVGIDPSPRMLAELSRLAKEEGLSGRLVTKVGTVGLVDEILSSEVLGSFDGAYSMFGAFDLERRLDRTPTALARLLRPGSQLVVGLRNRTAVVATGELLVAGHPRLAAGRCRSNLQLGGFVHPFVVAPTVGWAFARRFERHFDLESVAALSVLAPPFPSRRLERFWGPEGLARLAHLDRRLTVLKAFAWAADQISVTLTRRG
ncbi:MAG: class I SAM-dependent methyltransferase [Thermoplasmata archaeon]